MLELFLGLAHGRAFQHALFSDAGSALDLATMLINLLLHAVGLVAGFGLLLAVGYPLTAETVLLTTFVVVFIGTALAVAK
jgi:hypothetical protein